MPPSLTRRTFLSAFGLAGVPRIAWSGMARTSAAEIVAIWYDLAFDLVRHTPTYSPPVASRAFAYMGVALYESTRATELGLETLAGQLAGLAPLPQGKDVADAAITVHAALAVVVADLFANTGPTGQRALAAVTEKLGAAAREGVDPGLASASETLGRSIGAHILGWSAADGGARIDNLGFAADYPPATSPAEWIPTSTIALQQTPLLPDWGRNRPFAMPPDSACRLPGPTPYSEGAGTPFHAEAMEVYETAQRLSDEQAAIARFWADDAMLSRTPPGHWVSIALAELDREGGGLARRADVLARVGIAVADAFIACWHDKFAYRLVRPVTYIRRNIDPSWTPLLSTPPFPEYPSGHSTVSGAAAEVLTALFGEDHAFEDRTPSSEGLPPRSFSSFRVAADEAGISRLYGGIHFRPAIESGLEQGRCVAAYTIALRTGA